MNNVELTSAAQFNGLVAKLDPKKPVALLVQRDNVRSTWSSSHASEPAIPLIGFAQLVPPVEDSGGPARHHGAPGLPYTVDVIDVDADPALVARFDELVPVLLADGASSAITPRRNGPARPPGHGRPRPAIIAP